jgi:hypothetical protein
MLSEEELGGRADEIEACAIAVIVSIRRSILSYAWRQGACAARLGGTISEAGAMTRDRNPEGHIRVPPYASGLKAALGCLIGPLKRKAGLVKVFT